MRRTKNATKLAAEYLGLNARTDLSKQERARLRDLSRTLTARGLDPKHCGLEERAKVSDNLSLVRSYVENARRAEHADKVSAGAQHVLDIETQKLRVAGISTNRKHLQELVRQITENQRAADRLKHTDKTRAPHRNASVDELDAIAEEEDDVEEEGYAETSD